MILDLSNVGTSSGFCHDTAALWQFVGWIVTILKVVIPAILIIIGIISFGKAVISSDDKEIKSAIKNLITKFIIAVVIFFIPSIVKALFFSITSTQDVKPDSEVCISCITSPSKCSIPAE